MCTEERGDGKGRDTRTCIPGERGRERAEHRQERERKGAERGGDRDREENAKRERR